MSDPTQSVRDAYAAQWGTPSRKAEFRKNDWLVEVDKWAPAANPEGVALYATLGASRYPVPGWDRSHRVEFILGLLPERDDAASALAALALYPQREGVPVEHGHTVPADGPLWPGTKMDAFLVMRPVSKLIPTISVDGLHIEILQAIPIFESERVAIRKQSPEKLIRDWDQRGVPFWDPEREPSSR